MGKTRAKNCGIFYQDCRETKDEIVFHFDIRRTTAVNLTAAITTEGSQVVKQTELLSLKFVCGILIVLFSLIGCADNPYTGSTLTPGDVDKYITTFDDEVCLQTNTDSACLKLTPNRQNMDNVKVPVIHIHPQKLVYVFYHEGKQILRAERAVDTSEIVEALTTGTKPDPVPQNVDPPSRGGGNPPRNNNPPPTNNNLPTQDDSSNDDDNTNGNSPPPSGGGNPPVNNNPPPDDQNPISSDGDIDAPHVHNDGWTIWVGYPEGTAPTGPPTLENSGLKIKINGEEVSADDIRSFAQVEDFNGKKGIQFFFPTGQSDSSELEIEVDGLVEDEETVTFSMNSPVETSPEHVTYQTQPL